MRLQHNIEPPAPGRGGNRKRKRGAEESSVPAVQGNNQTTFTPSSGPTGPSGFSTFKVEPHTPSELLDDHIPYSQFPRDDSFDTNGRRRRSLSTTDHLPFSYPLMPFPSSGFTNGNSEESDLPADALPEYLAQQIDPKTGLIKGRTPAMVMYLLMKARHRYASEQRDLLSEELKTARQELRRLRDDKERALDDVLRICFGPQAEQFIVPLVEPGMSDIIPDIHLPPTPSHDLGYSVTAPPMPPYINGHGR